MIDSEFHKELEDLLNKHSMENESGTPDYILALYLLQCLSAFNSAVTCREQWHGRSPLVLSDEATSGKTQ